ncbi:Myosin heavy chain [hydrothermal vent metagenome]|uniref:Myosin heavy chain n=1 Tax=hydrothermal vent metagenome TaxID=652676 RepID=A0A1W1E8Z5_9ZZZZ
MQKEDQNTTVIIPQKEEAESMQPSTVPVSAELYQHVSMVVREVENRYREGILAYIDVLARYEEEIAQLQQKLSEAKAVTAPEEAKLSLLAQEVRIEERMLERLNSEFLQKITNYEAFAYEYSPLIEKESAKLLERSKHGEIKRLSDEIEEGEMKLLSLELERLNQLEKLEPLRLEIGRIERALAELERKKRYFETTHLQQMHLQPNSDSLLPVSSSLSHTEDAEESKS